MESLVSKPKTPAPARIQFVNVPEKSTAGSTNTTGTVTSDTSTSGQTDNGAVDGLSDKETSTLRAENIARRSRGRGGTVKTGFNGLLAINQITPSRKSLLGE